jgi:hypothetical protein
VVGALQLVALLVVARYFSLVSLVVGKLALRHPLEGRIYILPEGNEINQTAYRWEWPKVLCLPMDLPCTCTCSYSPLQVSCTPKLNESGWKTLLPGGQSPSMAQHYTFSCSEMQGCICSWRRQRDFLHARLSFINEPQTQMELLHYQHF